MHDIERELIKVTGYKVQRKFSDRQDYLKSLFNAVQKLTDDDFDNLSDDAATWANACVEAHNNKRDGDIPDFDEVDPTEEDDESEEAEESDDSEDEEAEESDEDVDDKSEESSDEETNNEAETEIEDNSDQIEMNLKVEKPKKETKPTKLTKSTKKVITKKESKTISEEDVVLDKWGCMEGSKNSQALAMFEKGATAAEVKNTIGGTYYNILGKMTKQGHKLTKAGSLIKLTHMSEKESRVSSPKKSKK
jgi:hypothetical protein